MSGCCMARSSSLPKQGWLQRHSGDRPTPPPFPPLPTLTSRHICWSLINVPVRRGATWRGLELEKGDSTLYCCQSRSAAEHTKGKCSPCCGPGRLERMLLGGGGVGWPRICGRNNSFALGHQWAHLSTLEGRLLGRKPAVVLYFLPCQICPSPFLSPLWF